MKLLDQCELPIFARTITLIFKELLTHFEGLCAFYTKHCIEQPNSLIKEEDVGHLLPLKCGHRGKPTRTEEKVIEHLFNISGFLDPHFVPASSSSRS